ncbi:hypothetical protein Fcan01_27514 [Folsomia candida]|uniref:Uncharacterized protein n=1 Tax=Folsomia candida TaxID=158441 RepID=A0A226D078_FOLCA|nr:hypothetical protein Fcan01_27514 [Folsomia candida]
MAWLQKFALIALSLISIPPLNASTLEDLIRNGTRLEWTYLRDGVRYYMTPDLTADKIDSTRQRFIVSYSIYPPFPTTPPPTTTNPSMSTSPTTSTTPTIPTTPDENHIPNGSFSLRIGKRGNPFEKFPSRRSFVTPRTRRPFDFFLGSYFPAETAAIFSLQPYQFHLNSSYRGERSHILPTLEEIATLETESNRVSAYTQLITRMHALDHVKGRDIFNVAAHMAATLPANHAVFYALPDPARFIFTRNVALTFEHPDGALYPMKYFWGSDLHQGFEPYSILPTSISPNWPLTNISVAIIYGNRSLQQHRIFVNPTNRQVTQEILGQNLPKDFTLHLGDDLFTVTISWNDGMGWIGTQDVEPDFYFDANKPIGEAARFKIVEF